MLLLTPANNDRSMICCTLFKMMLFINISTAMFTITSFIIDRCMAIVMVGHAVRLVSILLPSSGGTATWIMTNHMGIEQKPIIQGTGVLMPTCFSLTVGVAMVVSLWHLVTMEFWMNIPANPSWCLVGFDMGLTRSIPACCWKGLK